MKNSYAIIMAGGIGSRFWPISRTSHPKQFIDILGTGKTLIQDTYERFIKILPKENILIVSHESYRDLIQQQLPEVQPHQILYEPVMRNTAPCIAYACYKIRAINPQASVVVAPADHLILDTETFLTCIKSSLEVVSKNDCLITLGIKPSRPDTGYGYIQYNTKKIDKNYFKVKTFTEKPSLEMAQSFVKSGDFLWNAGIFIWSIQTILKAFVDYLPEVNEIFKEGTAVYNTPDEQAFIASAYSQCTNISIDYGIMEKANNVYVLSSDFGWSDLGTWSTIYELSEKDSNGNVALPPEKILLHDSSNCMIKMPKDKLVVLNGLHDYIVVEDNNTLLICPRNEEQKLKQLVAHIKQNFGSKFI